MSIDYMLTQIENRINRTDYTTLKVLRVVLTSIYGLNARVCNIEGFVNK